MEGVLLQLPPLVSELAHFCEKDADLVRKGLAEVVDVSVQRRTRQAR